MASTAPTGHLAPVPTPHSYLDRVQSLRDNALRLLRESNACVPIGRLPPEILSAIFVEAGNECSWPGKQARARIAGVSHHWHQVALATPSVWKKLILHDLNDIVGMQQSLSRTNNCPLDIHIIRLCVPDQGPNDWEPDDAQFLLDEVPRAQLLEVNADMSDLRGMEWPQLSISLKSLYLKDANFEIEHRRWDMDSREHEPLDLLYTLATRFPNLRTLMVAYLGVILDEVHPPDSLVELCIDNHIPLSRSDDSPTSLIALRNLPALERLSLINATTDLDTKAIENLEPISLPRLKLFAFAGPISTWLCLLKALRLPRSLRWRITLPLTEGDALSLYNEVMVELTKEDNFSSAFVGSNSKYGPKIMAWKDTQPTEELDCLSDLVNDPQPKCPADVLVDFVHRNFRHENTLRNESLFSHVRTMVLSYPLSRIFEASLHTQLSELEELSCIFELVSETERDREFFQRLKGCSSSFPRLRKLRLRWFSFATAFYDALLAFCRDRKRIGAKLDVQLMSCFEVSEPKLDELRTVTESVIWDGQMPSRRSR